MTYNVLTVPGTIQILFGFTGRDLDPNTGLQYNRARWYDAALSRWVSQDPIGFVARNTNLYRYAFNRSTELVDPSGEIVPLIILGALAGANIFIWGNNAEVADDIYNDRPLNLQQTPYSGEYYKRLTCSTAAGGAIGAATPIIASSLPAWATTSGGVGLAGYGVYSNGGKAIDDFAEGNYFSGTYHVGLSGISGYGGYQIARPLFPGSQPNGRDLMSEYQRYRGQGYSPRDARYLTEPYKGMGHHFLGRRLGLPNRIQESPFNVMKPNGISRGCFYERHYNSAPFFYGTRLQRGSSWSGRRSGLQKPDIWTQQILGMPNQTTATGVITITIVTGQ